MIRHSLPNALPLPIPTGRLWTGLVVVAVFLGAFSTDAAEAPRKISFAEEVRPLLNKHCVPCHGGVKMAGDISFILRERALAEGKSGEIPIVPGDPEKSEVIYRVTTDDEDDRMPPPAHGPALAAEEIAMLREWIGQGAEWEEHWAYVAPKPQPLPAVSRKSWPLQPSDHFVLARLDAEKVRPAREADRPQWLRRVSFDLTGLPPTPEESEAFLKDRRSGAHERVVDRLLGSPAFGERWTSLWMDLARYADTQGYEKDAGRTVWPYRDWLIRAFNEDMPYDQFTVRQLAGDLLPDATIDDHVATVMQRLTPVNAEGGTDDEEFRVLAVLDRVNTAWEVWQGVTFRCVQCHAHPYDPIEHADYFRFTAFYNTSRDWDQPDDKPLLRAPLNRDDHTRALALDRRMRALGVEERRQVEAVAAEVAAWSPLRPDRAESTGLTTLEIRSDDGVAEVVTSGTVSHDSRFTLEFPLPENLGTLTALRLDALPKDVAAALLTPELGFVVTQFKAWLLPASTADASSPTAQDIAFALVLGDELEPFTDPDGSLRSGRTGWGASPRIDRPRHAVFVAAAPMATTPGTRLRLELDFNAAPNDQMPLVLNRGRFSVSSDARWTGLTQDEVFRKRRQDLAALREERRGIPSVDIPVMAEQDAHLRRVTSIFNRGNWLDKGEVVTAGVPDLFPKLLEGVEADRLAMARWMVASENPLAARVAVNRFWEQLFGMGLVETLEDFGSSGTPPSHPALLDFLALRFQHDLGWSSKRLLRELVLSAAYRQDHRARPELAERDPRNRLLARGPRNRLTAEMLRDQALAVSGLLSTNRHGPPVMPPQPEGIWRSVYNSAKWETSKDGDQHRRAVYTYWKRTAAYPSFVTFDAPSRDVCSARRIPTSTPLQALVTLNDPVFFEAAQALAARMVVEGATPREQIRSGWERVAGRAPERAELTLMLELYERSVETFHNDPAKSGNVAHRPEIAALTVVANTLLNLDVALTK